VTVPLPVSMTVDVPDTLEAKLAVYSDTDEIMMLLAPKGWTCTASYGADGSGGVDVSPRGAHVPTRKLGPHSLVQAIGGFETGGSPVQAAFSACPYFPAAAIAARSDLPEQACSTRSNSQIVEQISASVVAFEDPPGVDGAGENPANGVMTYSPVKGPGFFIDTCTLPRMSTTSAAPYSITSSFATARGDEGLQLGPAYKPLTRVGRTMFEVGRTSHME